MMAIIMIMVTNVANNHHNENDTFYFEHFTENEMWLERGDYAFFTSPNFPSFYGPEDNREWVFCVSFDSAVYDIQACLFCNVLHVCILSICLFIYISA